MAELQGCKLKQCFTSFKTTRPNNITRFQATMGISIHGQGNKCCLYWPWLNICYSNLFFTYKATRRPWKINTPSFPWNIKLSRKALSFSIRNDDKAVGNCAYLVAKGNGMKRREVSMESKKTKKLDLSLPCPISNMYLKK